MLHLLIVWSLTLLSNEEKAGRRRRRRKPPSSSLASDVRDTSLRTRAQRTSTLANKNNSDKT